MMQTVQKYIYHYVEDFISGKQNIASINIHVYTKSMFSDLIAVLLIYFLLNVNKKIELPPFIMICSTLVHVFMPYFSHYIDFSSSGSL